MNPIDWSNSSVMITGGTGSFGKKFAEIMLREYHPKKLIVFSRDELKQEEMQLHGLRDPSLRFFLGDVRDRIGHMNTDVHRCRVLCPRHRGES